MPPESSGKFFAPADRLLNWAVGRDLQQRLKQIEGYDRDLATILRGAEEDLPAELFASHEQNQRLTGEMLFRFALAFILLHELAHLHYAHRRESGYLSIQQEKDADWFAAEWLLDAASEKHPNPEARCLHVLFGVSVALLWLTVFNVFLGQSESESHPEGYDRLFQVLDRGIDPADHAESPMVWYFVSTLLFIHMDSAGFNIAPSSSEPPTPEMTLTRLLTSSRTSSPLLMTGKRTAYKIVSGGQTGADQAGLRAALRSRH